MRVSYELDLDAFLAGTRGRLIERILGEEKVQQGGGEYYLEVPLDHLSDALFRFGRAITRIYGLILHSHTRTVSTFYEDLAELILEAAAEREFQRDYTLPGLRNSDAYPVDYRFNGKNGGQVFLYGVPNRDKARLTTIILSYFHRAQLKFDSILVFSDQTKIPSLDLARLSAVGGDMVPSLACREDLHRKLEQRIAQSR